MLIARKQNLDAGMGDKERQLQLTQQAADQAKQLLDAYEAEVERRSGKGLEWHARDELPVPMVAYVEAALRQTCAPWMLELGWA